jgi:hypothetical protein
MINYSQTDPRIYPVFGAGLHEQIDRIQGIDPTETLNREKKKELGTDGTLGFIKKSPAIAYRMTQLENGSFNLFRRMANKANSVNSLTLNDFKTSYFDICAFLTDDDDVFKGTIQYPSLRLAGFTFDIGDPQADIMRTFDLVGESAITWINDNKYVVCKDALVPTGVSGEHEITISDPVAVADPDNGRFMLRVVRIRGGVSSELTFGTDYTADAESLTITAAVAADTYRYWYTATTYITGQALFTTNTSDPVGLSGDCVSLYIAAGSYLYKIQDVSIDAKFEREDKRELGNKNIVQRGVKSKTVTVSFNRFVEDFTIEQALRAQSAGYGKIDIERLSTDLTFYMKVYSDNDKGTFKWGLKCTGMSPTELRPGMSVDEYLKKGATLEGESMTISTTESDILAP